MIHWIQYHHWPKWSKWTTVLHCPWPATGWMQSKTCELCKRQRFRFR